MIALSATILAIASSLLSWQASYRYGGSQLTSPRSCIECKTCLMKKNTKLSDLNICPQCSACSIDCSHFTHLVFQRAQAKYPYLTTKMMRQASFSYLDKVGFITMGLDFKVARPADLLVYDGHVALLEKKHNSTNGDIIHATSGKELRGPGMGIQRARNINLVHYKGGIKRILRHHKLLSSKPYLRRIRKMSHTAK